MSLKHHYMIGVLRFLDSRLSAANFIDTLQTQLITIMGMTPISKQ